MAKYQYEQNQRVYFNLDGKIKGWAKICGSATEEMPVIGRSWIIEPEDPVPFNKVIYPFTHITAFSCQVDVEEFEAGKNQWNKDLPKPKTSSDENHEIQAG